MYKHHLISDCLLSDKTAAIKRKKYNLTVISHTERKGCKAKYDLTHVPRAELTVVSLVGNCEALFDMIPISMDGYPSKAEHTRR